VLLTFYDFPAEHWKHLRSHQPREEHFRKGASQDHQVQGCLSRKTAMTMVFKICQPHFSR
jgi:hypothetical protein